MDSFEMLATENWPIPIDDIANPPEVPKRESNVELTICMVPNKTPYECFADRVETYVFQNEFAKTGTRLKNTLIGLVEESP